MPGEATVTTDKLFSTYKLGKLDGTMTMYGTNGQVLKTIDYENGSVKKNLPPKLK